MSVLIPIGYSFFQQKKYINPALTKALIMKRKQVLYEKENWKIYEDQFEKKWKIIFESMFQAYANRLLLDNNRYEKMISSLIHTKFTRLKQINLCNSFFKKKTTILQVLIAFTRSICLKYSIFTLVSLHLTRKQFNFINKTITQESLQENIVYWIMYIFDEKVNNKIGDLRFLNEFGNTKLKKLAIQWFDDIEICHDLSWIFKLKTKQITFISTQIPKIGLQSQQRMENYRLNSMIDQLFPSINLCRSMK